MVELGETRVRRLGGDRAGEMRITRFLRNRAVTVQEMIATAFKRTAGRVQGRHILAIQDTTDARTNGDNTGVALHPMIAVDAADGALLGLVHAEFLRRPGGRPDHRTLPYDAKESARWLRATRQAVGLQEAGAASVTVVADRECDIYEDLAGRPQGIDLLIRASHDRLLADGHRLFATADALPEAGRMTVDLPAAPGRKARTATLSLRFATVEISRPADRKRHAEVAALPHTVSLSLIDARELDPPEGLPAAHWRLLTSHTVNTVADAARMIGFYRQRWTIEQVFRTLKSKGFDIEAVRVAESDPFEKLIAAALVAAITVMQLTRERDGIAKRPLEDAFDPEDQPLLEKVSVSLEGKTQKQKNPHPKGSLAFVSWVFARLGGWNGYYGKPGPIVIYNGLIRFQSIRVGFALRDV